MVLPGLLLRALIPLGLMPMFGAGGSVQLTLCEGYAPVASTALSMSMYIPMDSPVQHPSVDATGSRGSDDSRSHHQDRNACPYGASPALAALTALPDAAVTVSTLTQPFISAAQVSHFGIEPRAQSPRGPPVEV